MGTHKVHAGYTLLLPLRPDSVETAFAWLERGHLKAGFERSETTHFASVTILPADRYNEEPLPATLLFATSFCGPAVDHVAELAQLMGHELDELFCFCEDYRPHTDIPAFIAASRHSDCFYSGMQNVSPKDVRDQARLREVIEAFLDREKPTGNAKQVRAKIRDFVAIHEPWALVAEPLARGTWRAAHTRAVEALAVGMPIVALSILGLCWHPLIVISIWGAVIAIVIAIVLSIRLAESQQTFVAERLPDAYVNSLAATQVRPVINEFVIAGPVKEEGPLRPMFLQAALWVVEAAVQSVPHIPQLATPMEIPTVATARWIAADGGRRLIFISNYTNAAEDYVRDFIDTPAGAKNINISFGFGRGYPKTRWVVKDGAVTDPNAFAYVVANNQRPSVFWYGPYVNLSVDNIRINKQIRDGIVEPEPDEPTAQAWLYLL
ncbi:MAG TPA: hypothetical protein VGC41_27125 [Kofleriaceae bacterium]